MSPDPGGATPVLVTGARGLLGRAVLRELARRGLAARAVTRPGSDPDDLAVPTDVLDLAADGFGRTHRLPAVSGVIHCAAQLPASHAGSAAQSAAEVNARIDSAVVDLCSERALPLVYVSSISVYGETGPLPIDESGSLRPPGPYASGKLASERAVESALDSFCILRPSAIYGPEQRAATVLRTFVENAVAGRALRYHGTGTREQDFIHADDVAHACVQAHVRRPENAVLNVCSGDAVTMRELAELVVRSVPGSTSSCGASGSPDPQEGSCTRYDGRRARRVLDWAPRTTLERGVVAWVRQLLRVDR